MGAKMRIAAGQFNELTEERLVFIKQLGIEEVLLNTPKLPGEKRWEFIDLLRWRTKCEDYGLKLIAIENVPQSFMVKIKLGLPGRDEQIENYQHTIRAMGRAGIPILGYNWMADTVWRTSTTTPERGGARVTSFDYELVKNAPLSFDRVYSAEEMWNNFAYFAKAVMPVAEDAGVKLALHPDDPPVPSLGGVARIMSSFEGFRRAMEVSDSPSSGLDFCQGCWSEMGIDVLEAIRYFGSRDKILYVHFRDVKGTVPCFRECFVNEGNVNMLQALRTYKEVGFSGFFINDHVPHMIDDTDWGHRSRAWADGYITALLEVVNSE